MENQTEYLEITDDPMSDDDHNTYEFDPSAIARVTSNMKIVQKITMRIRMTTKNI